MAPHAEADDEAGGGDTEGWSKHIIILQGMLGPNLTAGVLWKAPDRTEGCLVLEAVLGKTQRTEF